MTFIQHSETIATATANSDLIELRLDERWGLPEHKEQVVGRCSLTQLAWVRPTRILCSTGKGYWLSS